MIMPKLGGKDCYLELKKINPDVKAILSTGYGLDGKAQEIMDEGIMGFVQKPYRVELFSKVIADILATHKK